MDQNDEQLSRSEEEDANSLADERAADAQWWDEHRAKRLALRRHFAQLDKERERRYRWNGIEDECVMRALNLLDPEDRPDANCIVVAPGDEGVAATAYPRRRRIVVNSKSHTYRLAANGDVRELAATLAHESAHLQGHDDAVGYQVSARLLRRFGCDPETVRWHEWCAEEAAHAPRGRLFFENRTRKVPR